MKILIVASYNCGKYSPFVLEQAESTKKLNIQIDYFPVIAVAADSEIDLFAVRCGFFSEMDEKVAVFLVV